MIYTKLPDTVIDALAMRAWPKEEWVGVQYIRFARAVEQAAIEQFKIQVAATIATERALLQIDHDRLRAERDALAGSDFRLRAEIAALRKDLNDHLESEAVETMRADKLRAELAVKDKALGEMIQACSDTGKLRAERDSLLALIDDLDAHEGAEGWSEGLRERIDAARKEVK